MGESNGITVIAAPALLTHSLCLVSSFFSVVLAQIYVEFLKKIYN